MEISHVVYVMDDGVIGLGRETSYGMDIILYIDGIEIIRSYEPDEYKIVGLFDYIFDTM